MLNKKQELEQKIAALEAEREELERLEAEQEMDEDFAVEEDEDNYLNGIPYDQLTATGKLRCKMKPFLRKVYVPRCICSFVALTALIPGGIVALQMMSTSSGTGFLDPTAMAILMLLAIPGILCGWFATPKMMLTMLIGTPILCGIVGFVLGFIFLIGVGCLFGALLGFVLGLFLGIFLVTGGSGLISTIYFFRELRYDPYVL